MPGKTGVPARPEYRQDLRFCRSSGGVRIAYAVHGTGPPLVVNSCWLSHLQHDWHSPVWRHFLDDLGQVATVIRYDERGHGLSDWDVSDFSFEPRIADLEAVVDTAGLERFALLGMSQGGPVAIAYTHRHPQRVSRLVLYGTYAVNVPDPTPEDLELNETYLQMMRVGWARPNPQFRRVFTNELIPGATEEQMRWVDELQRTSTSTANAVEALRQRQLVDVTDLRSELDLPTLVIHARGDQMRDFDKDAPLLAAGIPGARLVPLESNNHIVLADEPAWGQFMAEVSAFLAPDRIGRRSDASPTTLTGRETDIVSLAAQGMDNAAIAERLTLSVRTVERHLPNAYLKLGVAGKSARAAAVARLLGH
ncbi:MAG: alpha/beta fold hydrolase [Jiangellaceae bacterium]